MASLGAFDWIALAKDAVREGDIISVDAGGMPIYRVVSVADGKARLHDLQRSIDQLLPLNRFHWKAALA